MKRKLSAIMAADVVGYSRLMGEDEVGTLERLKQIRRSLVQPAIQKHSGRVVKLMGDGLLAEFSSAGGAVESAVDIQRSLHASQTLLPEDQQIKLRIGINLGDIIAEGTDIYGDGVNIAARLEALADPGGICVSESAQSVVKGKSGIRFVDTGQQQVKNIKTPVQTYRVEWGPMTDGPPPTTATTTSETLRPSIAILPFANMSGDPEQEYFSDGITEDLITEISRFRELAVISRNSCFVFKGKNESLRNVSEKLNAQYLVEGSVRKVGNRIRVTAQLIDAAEDAHVWAERYDRAIEDIFEVQDDIVGRIAGTLVGRLEAGRLAKTKGLGSDQLLAHDLFLRGRAHFFNWSMEDNDKARECLLAALEIEPDYAAAMALLSEVMLRMWLNGWSEDAETDLVSARELAERADALDGDDSRTKTSLGMAYLFGGDLDKAKHHFETALRINPNDTRVIVYYSRHAVFDGDTDKAIELCHQALALNPYGKYNWNLGLASFAAHDYQEVITLLEAIRNPPSSVLALLAASYAMTGHTTKAQDAYKTFTRTIDSSPVMRRLSTPADWQRYYSERWPFRDAGDLNHLIDALRKSGMPI